MPALAATKVIDITKPESKNEVVEKSVYSICGYCVYDETYVEIFRYDQDDDKYKPLETVDGDTVIKVGAGKFLAANIELNKGENNIKIKSYTKATKDDPQEDTKTITYSEKKKKNWLDALKDWVENK